MKTTTGFGRSETDIWPVRIVVQPALLLPSQGALVLEDGSANMLCWEVD